MPAQPEFSYQTDGSTARLVLQGDWTVHTIGKVSSEIAELDVSGVDRLDVDCSDVGRLDTAGAYIIDRLAEDAGAESASPVNATDQIAALFEQASAVRSQETETFEQSSSYGFVDLLERTGRTTHHFVREMVETLSFLGETVVSMLHVITKPARMRWTALVSVMEDSGLDAVPIVAFLAFFVGMVIAFIGATTLSEFGATIFTVELVGIAVLREFAVILTAIILAGRTNSAFTAQIGAMKMRQEVDAMVTLGLNPMDVLVVPRVFAMLIMTPVLTVVATIFGIGGGAFVSWIALDINPTVFINRMQEFVPIENFWVGMSKAPVFGLVVALIGCRQGLLVGGSVQSLGQATTKSVVQALFSIIVIDALFAVFYMELGI
ncbi:ABC transporter permease [Henriciella litoralis]|uniref:ABC transporter permease n=1 Tax=Henriciella litoralis TaxID=568102 RepID=UPI000A06B866|nr:MlaE family lipid ABC transporter permease subunit [Henriciella litoralis]